MDSGTSLTHDRPERCRDVVDVVEAEQTTIVDAVLTGKLDQGDLDTFLEWIAAADDEIDPGVIHLITIANTLLETRDI